VARGPIHPRVWTTGALTGARVRNADGEDLGRIEEILVDVSTGRVVYVLIASGGVMGIGEKLFAVPWDAFTGASDGEVLIDADRSRLERSARFDPIRWQDPADPAWVAHLDQFYGAVENSRH
jgi:sporulation protein YlmC with PRC-barrel domain